MRQYDWRCESHAAGIKLVMQYWKFLYKNLKWYLIICSPRVQHIWELKESFPTPPLTCGTLYYTHYMRKCKAIKLAITSGFGFQLNSLYMLHQQTICTIHRCEKVYTECKYLLKSQYDFMNRLQYSFLRSFFFFFLQFCNTFLCCFTQTCSRLFYKWSHHHIHMPKYITT
jgi:hypothetical protein